MMRGSRIARRRGYTYDGGDDLGHSEMAKQRRALFAGTSTGLDG